MACNRCNRGASRRRRAAAAETVITNPQDCCVPPDSISEELYSGIREGILMLSCCDYSRGCTEFDARNRCTYWPSFAHPRWLTCRELYNHRPV